MAKAATELGISQPSVSARIAALEHALKVRLFDRSPRGVEPTQYGEALLARGQAAFDELRQGIRDIEFLSDAAAGEVRIGCSETICPGLLTPIIERLSLTHPRLNLKVEHVVANPPDLRGLQERRLDLVMGPLGKKLPSGYKAEISLNDGLRVVAGANSPWAARSKIEIGELADERWIMQPPELRPRPGCRGISRNPPADAKILFGSVLHPLAQPSHLDRQIYRNHGDIGAAAQCAAVRTRRPSGSIAIGRFSIGGDHRERSYAYARRRSVSGMRPREVEIHERKLACRGGGVTGARRGYPTARLAI